MSRGIGCAICGGRKKPGAWALNPDYGGDTYVEQFVWCCGVCFDAAAETVGPDIRKNGFYEQRDKTLTEMIRLARIRRAEDFVAQQGEQAK